MSQIKLILRSGWPSSTAAPQPSEELRLKNQERLRRAQSSIHFPHKPDSELRDDVMEAQLFQ